MSEIQTRLLAIIRLKQSRCHKFCSLFRYEFASNNLPYGLFVKTSPFNPRSFRLAVLYFGVLLELVVCAFFFDLNEEPDESSSLLDNLIENFWVSVYLVLLSAVFLLLVGLTHSLPLKLKKSLQ